jgi:molecular chaperone DnaK
VTEAESIAVGIDFGTSYSSISAAIGDRVYMLADDDMHCLHPSIVHYTDTGLPIAGWRARELYLEKPHHTIMSPKRMLGLQFDEERTAAMLHSLPMPSSKGPDGSVVLHIEGHEYSVLQLCVPIISHLRELGEKVLGVPITEAVFSVPITFDEGRRNALRRAAELAGIETLAQIEEPVAAAMGYGFGKNRNEIVAVYDFGGGTFDFTVVDISGYSFEVLARGGDPWLGGDDFDLALANVIADAFWKATNVEMRNRAVEWQRLVFACEEAKRSLSETERSTVNMGNVIDHPRAENLEQPITREQLEKFCDRLVQQSVNICRSAMDRSGLEVDDIAQVVMSGGVSHIPFVRRAVSKLFGRPVELLVDPDRAICLGAGLRAAQLCKKPVRGAGGVIGPK